MRASSYFCKFFYKWENFIALKKCNKIFNFANAKCC